MSSGLTTTHHTEFLSGVQMFYRRAGEGEPVVLLHGLPNSSYEWRHVIPLLAERYTVIAPDLRGIGYTSRPAGGYDKRTVAGDVHELVQRLGLGPVKLVGRDFGAPVAYTYAAQFREEVERLVLMELALPGTGYDRAALDFTEGGGAWHFAFHMAPDVPEMLVAGREREYLTHFFDRAAYDPEAISEADVDEYLRGYAAPGGMRAYFEYYRAWPKDMADNEESRKDKLTVPVLSLVGDHTDTSHVADAARAVAEDVEEDEVADCGHWIPEEQPDALAKRLLTFFARP